MLHKVIDPRGGGEVDSLQWAQRGGSAQKGCLVHLRVRKETLQVNLQPIRTNCARSEHYTTQNANIRIHMDREHCKPEVTTQIECSTQNQQHQLHHKVITLPLPVVQFSCRLAR